MKDLSDLRVVSCCHDFRFFMPKSAFCLAEGPYVNSVKIICGTCSTTRPDDLLTKNCPQHRLDGYSTPPSSFDSHTSISVLHPSNLPLFSSLSSLSLSPLFTAITILWGVFVLCLMFGCLIVRAMTLTRQRSWHWQCCQLPLTQRTGH